MILNPTNHWKLGLFVVGALATGFGALVYFGADRLSRETFSVVSYFGESVEGLDVGSPVKYRGVTLGRVENITFAPNRTDVAVTSEIFFETVRRLGLLESLPSVGTGLNFEIEGLRVQLARSGITGIAYLEADVFDPQKMPVEDYDFTLPWNHVPSTQSTMVSLEGTLTETLEALPELLTAADRLVTRIDRSVDTLDVARLADELHATLTAVRELTEGLQGVDAAGLTVELRGAVADARTAVADLSDRLAPLGPAADDLRGAAAAARGELERTGSAVRESGEQVAALAVEGQLLARDLRFELDGLGETLESLRQLIELFERNPSALLRGRND